MRFHHLLLSGLLVALQAQSQSTTSAQWHQDLAFFKQTVHEKYSNLFYNVTSQEFDSAVNELDKKVDHLNDMQVRTGIVRIVSMFHVGHTAVRRQWGTGAGFTAWVHTLPVRFYWFNDGLYIKAIHPDYKAAVGAKVTRIGSMNTEQALLAIKPYISFENEQGFKNLLQYYLNTPEYLQAAGIINDPGKVTISYTLDGKEGQVTLKAITPVETPRHGSLYDKNWVDAYENIDKPGAALWLKDLSHLRYFEYLPATRTVYVRHSAVQDEEETIEQYFQKVFRFIDSADVERFVLDIRLNGGGNNYLNKSVITGIIASRKINRKGHFFVILGKATFSAAQNLTNELEKYTEVTFVGEPTSENVNFFGDTRTEVLPNSKLNIALSWLWWQNLDPRDKRIWTAPQLAADMDFSDYKNGIDPCMDVIMKYKDAPDLIETAQRLIKDDKYDEFVVIAKDYLADPVHRYLRNDLEKRINDYGYELMNSNNPAKARKVLYLNVQLFPNSANACDSYAEACWKSGDKQEATKYYNRSIELDPHGITGENSRRMLEDMKKQN